MHRRVAESAALHHDVLAKQVGIGDLQHLVQGILDHRVGQAGRDIVDRRALAQGLLDPRVHEDGAARAQVAGSLSRAGQLGKIGHAVAHAAGKRFDE